MRAFAISKLGAETAEILCKMAERPCWPMCGQHCRFNRSRSTKPQQKGCKVHAVTFVVYLNAQVSRVIMPNLRVFICLRSASRIITKQTAINTQTPRIKSCLSPQSAGNERTGRRYVVHACALRSAALSTLLCVRFPSK